MLENQLMKDEENLRDAVDSIGKYNLKILRTALWEKKGKGKINIEDINQKFSHLKRGTGV